MVLMSIKPKYADRIFNGEKKYEFRKSVFKKDVEKVYVYSSSPVRKIIGYFTVEKILTDNPEKLWDKCRTHSGIDKDSFFEYFFGKDMAFALKIGSVCKFENPIEPNSILKSFTPPQSYMYIDDLFI